MAVNKQELPPLVVRANALAEKLSFPLMPEGRPVGYTGPASACIPEVGRLLMVLAASKPGGRFAEHGTGAGVGAAWFASGMSPDSTLVTVELDAERAAAVRELFKDMPNVEIRTGDWHDQLRGEAPFDLVFMDAGIAEDVAAGNVESLIDSVRVGGLIVMDDLDPPELIPPELEDRREYKRELAFNSPRLSSVEVRTTPTAAALICTRIR